MAVTIRPAVPDDWEQMIQVDGRDFGYPWDAWKADATRPYVDLDRFLVAVDGREIVGICGSYALEVTLPGLSSVPMAGTTWVSVAATHRRRGLLRRMITDLHRGIDERGEPLASLYASEGGIYERFGYGLASRQRLVTIATRATRLREDVRAGVEPVRFVSGDAARAHITAIWERFWKARPAEVRRDPALHDLIWEIDARAEGEKTPTFYLAHPDGLAAYRLQPSWNDGLPAGTLHLHEMCALTPAAHVSLWDALLGVDLVAEVSSWRLPLDDPLPYLLHDQRQVRTTAVNDAVWVNVRNAATCFAARTYGTTDRLVVEADGVRWAIDGSPDGASVRKVRTRADLVTDQATLGALLYGGVRPTVLAAGRRLELRSTEVARRADRFFLGDVMPHCQTNY